MWKKVKRILSCMLALILLLSLIDGQQFFVRAESEVKVTQTEQASNKMEETKTSSRKEEGSEANNKENGKQEEGTQKEELSTKATEKTTETKNEDGKVDKPDNLNKENENNGQENGGKNEEKETVVVPEMSGILEFLDEDERQKVLRVACSLEINENTRLHKALVQYKKQIAEYNAKLKNAQNQRYYNPSYDKPENEPDFFKEVSEDGIKRFMSILDELFKAVEKLGGSVNDDLSIKIRSDIVRIRVAEAKDNIKHELTKQEAQALLKYEDEIKRHSWASKPQIRQYDYVYNGRIRIVFGEKSYIRDSEKEKLEDRLGDILISLYEKSEENRIIRERREEEQRKREEEARRQEEIRKRKENEIKLTKELANKAEDYHIACEIRAYIKAMIENGNEEATPEWIEWAFKKADWYDPTKDVEDEYLGKRDHGKNKDEKDLDKIPVKSSWYW